MKMVQIRLDNVRVGPRHRARLGDLAALADSIRAIGLLHPIVVRPDGLLVAGARRLAAVRSLGWDSIAAHQVDVEQLARGERDENFCRLPFTPSEMVAIGAAVEAEERAAAAARQEATRAKPGQVVGKLPTTCAVGEKGKTRDKVAAALGVSRHTLEKARAVVEAAAAEPEKFGRLAAAMDRTGKVDGPFRRLQVARQAARIAAEPPPMPLGPFRVLAVDPPWPYEPGKAEMGDRATHPYPQMSMDQLRALKLPAAEDAILWLWSTNYHLREAFDLLAHWGFSYRTMLVWAKPRFGTGQWLRAQTEPCLMAIRGRPTVTLTDQSTLITAAMREHSRKPEEFYALVESLCPGSKVELFQRHARSGWAGFGDQAGGVAA